MPAADLSSENFVLDAIDGGIVVLDAHERVVRWNTWMAAASGLSLHEAQGKSLPEIFPDFDALRLKSAIHAALTAGASSSISHSLNTTPLPLRTRAQVCARWLSSAASPSRVKRCANAIEA